MKKFLTKIVSSVLAVSILFSSAITDNSSMFTPISALASEENIFDEENNLLGTFEYKVNDDASGAIITGFKDVTGITNLIIPETLGSLPVSEIGADAFADNAELLAVSFPSLLKKIGANAFKNCTKLETINTELCEDSLAYIDENAFEGTKWLGNQADRTFIYCGRVLIGYVGEYTGVTLSPLTSTIGIAQNAMKNCTSITRVTLGENLRVVGSGAFYGCTSLEKINDTTAPLEYIGANAFDDTLFINSLGDGVDAYVGTFLYKYRLTAAQSSAVSSSFSISDIKSGTTGFASYAIADINAAAISIPATVKYINEGAFSGNSALATIALPAALADFDVSALSNCPSLTAITITANSAITTPNYSAVNGVLYDNAVKTLIKYPEKKAGTSFSIPATVVSICENSFSKTTNLQTITTGAKTAYIGDNAFNSSSVTSLTFSAALKQIGDSAFYNCKSLKTVSFGTSSPDTIGEYAFAGTQLASMTVPDSVYRIGKNAFENCLKLATLKINDTSLLEKLDDSMISGCVALKAINIPTNVSEIGENVFSGCSALTQITVSDSNKTFCDISGVLFTADKETLLTMPVAYAVSDTAQTAYIIPSGTLSIEKGAFAESKLLIVTINDELVEIGENAFENAKLNSIEISELSQLEKICANAFTGVALSNIFLPQTISSIAENAFGENPTLDIVGFTATAAESFANNHALSFTDYLKQALSLSAFTLTDSNKTITAYKGTNSIVVIPEGITKIADSAFAGKNITKVILPNSLISIGANAFKNCTKLSDVIFPANLEQIGNSAFLGCTSMKNAFFKGDYALISSYGIGYATATAKIADFSIFAHDGTDCSNYANDNGINLGFFTDTITAEKQDPTNLVWSNGEYSSNPFDIVVTSAINSTGTPEEPIYYWSGNTNILTVAKSIATTEKNPVTHTRTDTIRITPVNYGSTTIYIKTESGLLTTVDITVNKAISGISTDVVNDTINLNTGGNEFTFYPTSLGDAPEDYIIGCAADTSSNDNKIITIEEVFNTDGSLKSVTIISNTTNKAGTVRLNLISNSGIVSRKMLVNVYVPATEITVKNKNDEVLSGQTIAGVEGGTYELTATATPSTFTGVITWQSSNPTVASVTNTGGKTTVTAKNDGETQITVSAVNSLGVPPKTRTFTFKVSKRIAVTELAINTEILDLTTNSSNPGTLVAIANNGSEYTDDLDWSIADTTIATLKKSGDGKECVVTPKKVGTTTITVKSAVDDAVSASCTLNVSAVTTSIKIVEGLTLLETEKSAPLTVVYTPTNSSERIIWTTDNEDIATVDENGIVTGVKAGTTRITAKTAATGCTSICSVTVKALIPTTKIDIYKNASDTTPITAYTASKGTNFTLTQKLTPTTSNERISWSVADSDSAILEIVESGNNGESVTLKPKANGTATVIVTSSVSQKTATCEVTVKTPATSIAVSGNIDAVSLGVGEPKTVTATMTPAGTTDDFIIVSNNEKIVTVTSDVKATTTGKTATISLKAVSTGSALITIKSTNDAIASKVIVVTVTKACSAVTLDKTTATMLVNDSINLNAVITPADTTDVQKWTSSNDSVVTVSQIGLTSSAKLVAVSAGSATITVTCGGKSAKCTVTVGNDLNKAIIADIPNQTFKNALITPELVITDGTKKLTLNTDYTVIYTDNKAVGKATVTIKGKGTYAGEIVKTFNIVALKLYDATFTITAQSYTGNEILAAVSTVKALVNGISTSLVKGTDYDISYENNINAGANAKAVVTLKGNYSGVIKKAFTINQVAASIFSVSAVAAQGYTGKAIEPDVTVTWKGNTLVEGKDYTVEYKNNINKGVANITINGIGNFSGTKTISFAISASNMSGLKFADIKNQPWTGKAIVPVLSITDGAYTLVKDTDYTVSVVSNINAGTATLTVMGKGNYTGSLKKTFVITKAVSKCTFTLTRALTYTGSSQTPTYSITDGTKRLVKDKDFTIVFSSNKSASKTAKAIITGKGCYTGTKTVYFTISPKSIASLSVKLSQTSYTYSAVAKTPSATIMFGKIKLVKNKDFTVKYKNNVKAGTATITITGKGNYTGVIKKTYTIKQKNLSTIKPKLSTTTYTYTGKAKKPVVTIKVGSTTLKLNTDYTVTYSANTKAGKASVTIRGKGNLTGTKIIYFTIKPAKTTISSASSKKTKTAVVTWKKNTQCTGYQIFYARNSKFTTGKKTVTVSSARTVSKTLTGLTKGKTYYVKVRAYKTIDGKKVYGSYSSVKSFKSK